MVVLIERDLVTPEVTLGRLYIDGRYLCETLEPPENSNRKGLDAVPAGEYRCKVSYSPSFKRETVELLGVPNRSKILLHSGNFPKDTRGCIVVAARRTETRSIWGESKVLEKKITEKVKHSNEPVIVTITYADHVKMELEEVKV